jgi:hypothetical protein
MAFQILPVENTQHDRDQVAKTLITAMYPDAYYRAIYPSTTLPDLIYCASLRLGANLQNSKAWFLKVVDPETQEIISYARYLLPPAIIVKLELGNPRRQLTEEEKERYERDAAEGSDGRACRGGLMRLCWASWGW